MTRASAWIEECFVPPTRKLSGHGARSTLYLLRRELRVLCGPENDDVNANWKAPILATSGIMTGFNLLAKFWTGTIMEEDKRSFMRFFSECLALQPSEAEALYKFRCALQHGFCLLDKGRYSHHEFVLDPDIFNLALIRLDGSIKKRGTAFCRYRIARLQLKKNFIMAIKKVERLLQEGNRDRLSCFIKTYPVIGTVMAVPQG